MLLTTQELKVSSKTCTDLGPSDVSPEDHFSVLSKKKKEKQNILVSQIVE